MGDCLCRLLRWGSGTAPGASGAADSELEQETQQPLLGQQDSMRQPNARPEQHQQLLERPLVPEPNAGAEAMLPQIQQQFSQSPAAGSEALTGFESESTASAYLHDAAAHAAPGFNSPSLQTEAQQSPSSAVQPGIGRFRHGNAGGMSSAYNRALRLAKPQASMPSVQDHTAATQHREVTSSSISPHQLQSNEANAESSSQQDGYANSFAAVYGEGKQALIEHQSYHPQRKHGLPPLVVNDSYDHESAPVQDQQVLRRRCSFRKAATADPLHRANFPGVPASFTGTTSEPLDMLVSSSGSSWQHQLMRFGKGHSSRVAPEDDGEVGLHATNLPRLHNIAGHMVKKKHVKKSKTCSTLELHSALRQSLTQVRLCTLQLQEHQREQLRAQQALQAMNAQLTGTVHEAITPVMQQ